MATCGKSLAGAGNVSATAGSRPIIDPDVEKVWSARSARPEGEPQARKGFFRTRLWAFCGYDGLTCRSADGCPSDRHRFLAGVPSVKANQRADDTFDIPLIGDDRVIAAARIVTVWGIGYRFEPPESS